MNMLQSGYVGIVLGHKKNNNKMVFSVLFGFGTYFYYQDAKGTRKSLKPTLKTSLTLVVFIMISMVESFL